MPGRPGFAMAPAVARDVRPPAARTEWPFVSGIVAGPGGTVAVRRVGELAILELSGRPLLRCQPRRDSPSRTPRIMLLTLVRGEAAFRCHEGRLRAVGPTEVLVLDSDMPLEVGGEEGAVLVGVTLRLDVIVARLVC